MTELLRKDFRKYRLRDRRRWWRLPRDIVVVVLVGLTVTLGVKSFALRSFYIPSPSMVPTLEVNDRIMVDLLTPRLHGHARGDVVVFQDPGSWLGVTPEPSNVWQLLGLEPEAGNYLVKRIIGMPGDTVRGETDGAVFVNDNPIDVHSALVAAQRPFELTLGVDEYWMMGDNRGNSADSRAHGVVHEDEIIGRAFGVFWPLDAVRAVS